MNLSRSAGVLLHVTSLPGRRLGREAYRFVDWLAAAGQSWWQMLPLGPPDDDGSPYMAASAFAAWRGLLASPRARVTRAEADAFRERESYWIEGWERFAGRGAVEDQVRFDREWTALREYAADRGVRLIGDLPIYVALDGADQRDHPELFQPGLWSGAPPDVLSSVGQLWGNPLYDWSAMRRDGYHWWVERLRRTCRLFDLARIDHFRGFVAYWAVRAGMRTAKTGRWRRGPGIDFFRAVQRELGPLPLIVEDLGVITPPVHELRDRLGLPGMVVLQFAFGGPRTNPHRPENHRRNLVVYTGTHDTDTTVGWFRSLPRRLRDATGLDPAEPNWSLVQMAYRSRAAVAIVPAQDLLGLDSSARMNMPGTSGPHNWSWRLRPGQLTPALAERVREATREARRT
jgi:4-alpha-glucanotransferase